MMNFSFWNQIQQATAIDFSKCFLKVCSLIMPPLGFLIFILGKQQSQFLADPIALSEMKPPLL